ncbi:MAG: hypothetical protein ABIH52_00395 [Candidatus Aenigmatarchaeota archaeon]
MATDLNNMKDEHVAFLNILLFLAHSDLNEGEKKKIRRAASKEEIVHAVNGSGNKLPIIPRIRLLSIMGGKLTAEFLNTFENDLHQGTYEKVWNMTCLPVIQDAEKEAGKVQAKPAKKSRRKKVTSEVGTSSQFTGLHASADVPPEFVQAKLYQETPIRKKDAPKRKEGICSDESSSTAEARRDYQRRYYQIHKEKAKEYQRQYNLEHKKKGGGGRGRGRVAEREVVRGTYNTADLMHSPVEKTLRMIEKIINGERLFTM